MCSSGGLVRLAPLALLLLLCASSLSVSEGASLRTVVRMREEPVSQPMGDLKLAEQLPSMARNVGELESKLARLKMASSNNAPASDALAQNTVHKDLQDAKTDLQTSSGKVKRYSEATAERAGTLRSLSEGVAQSDPEKAERLSKAADTASKDADTAKANLPGEPTTLEKRKGAVKLAHTADSAHDAYTAELAKSGHTYTPAVGQAYATVKKANVAASGAAQSDMVGETTDHHHHRL